jgi:hypothetical protein
VTSTNKHFPRVDSVCNQKGMLKKIIIITLLSELKMEAAA